MIRSLIVLSFVLTACDCRARYDRELEALTARADAEMAGIDLAELRAGYENVPATEDGFRVFVGADRVSMDDSIAIDAFTRTHAEASLPEVPDDLAVLVELDQGRLPDDATDTIDAGLLPVSTRARDRHDDEDSWLMFYRVDLAADRRVPWVTIVRLTEILKRRGWLASLMVLGPDGPQRLPLFQLDLNAGLCVRESTDVPEPTASPSEAPLFGGDGTVLADGAPCDLQRRFAVSIGNGGHTITQHGGSIRPDCARVLSGPTDDPTIPRAAGEYDYVSLRECVGRLRELFPRDRYVLLEGDGSDVSVDDYVQTWHALRGTEARPGFAGVYRPPWYRAEKYD